MYHKLFQNQNKYLSARLKLAHLAFLLGALFFGTTAVDAQTIEIDGKTPTTQVNGGASCIGDCTITGGTVAGSNLFHSFSRFNVAPNTSVTFTDPGVQNIVTRVTGNDLSAIEGILEVSGNANLFLFNPNGITVGDGASLQIEGSFIASTASGIQFEDGAFSLTDSSAANSLLTVNVTLGLQMDSGAGDIVVNGMGNSLFINPNSSIEDALFTPNLEVGQRQTLALVGHNVTLDGASLAAPEGRIEVGGASSGLVGLIPTANSFQLGYDNVDSLGNISLLNAAAIDVSGSSAGSVQLQGEQILMSGGSAVLANTLGDGEGGLVQVSAESLSIEGASSFVPGFIPPQAAPFVVMPSGIFASVGTGASGDGSQIDVNATQLNLTAGAQIAASTFGEGDAGDLSVVAGTVSVDGGRPAGPSGLFTTVAAGSSGGPEGAATGNGGNLTIAANTLVISNGGQISAGTFGFGNAGNLTVNASVIELTGSFGVPGTGGPSSLRSASERPWAGMGGNLTVEADRLFVADGGQIVTGTLSSNPAGDLVLRTSERIELSGGDAFGQSGLFASALFSSGDGGNITVETDELRLQDGATINVSNNPSTPGSTLPSGTGAAGNLAIAAQQVLLDDGSSLTADTVDGDRANIRVDAETLTLRNSRITTNANGTTTGGNITLSTEALTLTEDSTIAANAALSFGGQVRIDTQALLRSPESSITATSALGAEFDGVVEINTPDTSPYEEARQEENPAVAKQIVAACEQLTDNELVITGRGGLPADPTQVLTGQSLWTDIREAGAREEIGAASVTAEIHLLDQVAPADLNEARGLERNEQGQVVLVAQPRVASDSIAALGHQSSLCARG